jgi:Protein of unknown function (DUF3750)
MSDDLTTDTRTSPQEGTASSVPPPPWVVQLRYATLPHCLRAMAVHYWFVVVDSAAGPWHRWEVWQAKNAGGQSLGYVHCDRRHPDCGVGGGPYCLAAEWRGSAAQAIYAVLTKAQDYPYWDRYRAWPGPNSNTFVAWVLRQAGIDHALDPRAIGKDYMGLLGMRRSSQPACAQLETPLLGVKISLYDGVEMHVLGFTRGLRWSPLGVYTPFGRIGLRKSVLPARNDCRASTPVNGHGGCRAGCGRGINIGK